MLASLSFIDLYGVLFKMLPLIEEYNIPANEKVNAIELSLLHVLTAEWAYIWMSIVLANS